MHQSAAAADFPPLLDLAFGQVRTIGCIIAPTTAVLHVAVVNWEAPPLIQLLGYEREAATASCCRRRINTSLMIIPSDDIAHQQRQEYENNSLG
jgi:hypothetical protein